MNSSVLLLGALNGTAFYVLGSCLAVLAITVTALGLRDSGAFSSNLLARGAILLFAILVLATVAFAVRYSRDEQQHRRAKLAAEEGAATQGDASAGGQSAPAGQVTGTGGSAKIVKPTGAGGGKAGQGKPGAKGGGAAAGGPGGTLKLSADPAQIAFTSKALTSKPGKVTINFDNPAPIQHDVAIEEGGRLVAKSALISQSSTSVSTELAPGKYVFYCTVPGHRQAGMEGTLTVK